MTAREYAASCGVELVGKLTRKTAIQTRWDWAKGDEVKERHTYYIDEIGNELHRVNGEWCLVTADGGVV